MASVKPLRQRAHGEQALLLRPRGDNPYDSVMVHPRAWHAAIQFIETLGNGATSIVGRIALRLLEAGDLRAFLVWKQILTAVVELQCQKRREGQLLN